MRQLTLDAGTPGATVPSLPLRLIPRAPVIAFGVWGDADAPAWPRIDRQGQPVFTISGRTAILHGLRALGVGVGDRVLLPTYHCPTMVEPVVLLGAEPLFYPIDEHGLADMGTLSRLDLGGVRAMLAAHFFGLPLDLRPVRAFCDAHGFALIEDCAHAYFGRSEAGPLGALGDIAIASLPKFFPVVEGGCLVLRAPLGAPLAAAGAVHQARVVWDALELAAEAGRLGAIGAVVRGLAALKNRRHRRAPPADSSSAAAEPAVSPFRTIDTARAGAEAACFVRWVVEHADAERIVTARRRNYQRFAREFDGRAGLRPLRPDLPDGAAPYVFPLLVEDPERLYQRLRQRGVPLYRWDVVWPGTPQLPGDAGALWATRVLQLVCHQDMSEDDVNAVVRTIFAEQRSLDS